MAARSLNKVQLIGNLTRDPELRYTPSGTAVCSFGLATNRSWSTQTGEIKEETEFHRIVSWNKLAELCAQLLAKGRKVFVEGRLSTRTWTGADNVKRTTTEIVINEMIILDSKRVVRDEGFGGGDIKKRAEDDKALVEEVDVTKDIDTTSSSVSSQDDDEESKEKKKSEKEEKIKEEEKDGEEKKSNKEEKKVEGSQEKKSDKKKEEEAQNKEDAEAINPDDIPF